MITQPRILTLASVVYAAPFTVRARAVARTTGAGSCALVLDPAASGSFSMTGSTTVDFTNCNVSVNSSSATAVTLLGGAILNTSHLDVAGGYTLTGGAQINATSGITTSAALTPDPYAGYVMPTAGACLQSNYNPAASATISPGTYCDGITVRNGVTLTLNPGTYIINRGLLNLAGGASLSGTGVTIALTSSTGVNYATVNILWRHGRPLRLHQRRHRRGGVFSGPQRTDRRHQQSQRRRRPELYRRALFSATDRQVRRRHRRQHYLHPVVARQLTFLGNAKLTLNCAGTGVLSVGGHPDMAE